MYEQFTNQYNAGCIFNDEGIVIFSPSKSDISFIPYGGIDEISKKIGGVFYVHGRLNGEKVLRGYQPTREQRKRFKELLQSAFDNRKNYPAAEVIKLTQDELYKIMSDNRIQEKEKEALKTKEYFTFDEHTCTLTLLQRNKEIANYLTLLPLETVNSRYKEEKIHIGAVTVGGVTTGGVYKTGGYHYVTGIEKSGACDIMFKDHRVFCIQLNDVLYAQAKASTISKYLNDKKQIEVGNRLTQEEKQALRQAEADFMDKTGYLSGQYLAAQAPTLEKATEILNWICEK